MTTPHPNTSELKLLIQHNKIYIELILKKTPYELWKGRKTNISYFHIKRTFLGYSKISKAYRVYNSRTLTVEESIHVKFNDSKLDKELSELDGLFIGLDLGIDYTKTLDLIARLEQYEALSNGHQKTFLNGIITKEAFYGLKQEPCAWYEKLSSFLMNNGISKGKVDIIFYKGHTSYFIRVQSYANDIIFCAIDEILCKEFSKLMQEEFEMSMTRELKFF
ncbi:hypothetical protein CR513_01830, partial [Mucuna pruriens]